MRGDGFIREEVGGFRAYVRVQGKCRNKWHATERKAKEWLSKQRGEKRKAEAGVSIAPAPVRGLTIAKMAKELREYWAAGTERVYTERTLDSYEQDLKAVEAYWSDRPLLTIRNADVDQWVKAMREADLSTSSIRHRLDRLAQIFALAERREYIVQAPCKVRRPRLVQRAEPEAVPEAEYERLIVAATASGDPRRVAVILLAGDAGLRCEEIARLAWEDLTLDVIDGGTKWGAILVNVTDETNRTKSGHARTVPILTPRLRAALDALSWPGREGQVIAGVGYHGIRYMAQECWEAIEAKRRKELCDAGQPVDETPIPRTAHLHGLRHRFGTWLAENGAATKTIRDYMGHSTILTTERYLRRRTTGADAALLDRLAGKSEQEWSKNGPSRRKGRKVKGTK